MGEDGLIKLGQGGWGGKVSGHLDDEDLAAPAAATRPDPSLAAHPEAQRTSHQNEHTIADARKENNQGNLMLDPATGRVVLLSDDECGGATERYTWGQNEHEVIVRVPRLPEWTRTRNVEVSTASGRLRIAACGCEVLDGPTHAMIVSDETVFALEDEEPADDDDEDDHRTLVVRLRKAEPTKAKTHWRCVVVGEPEIDTARFGEPVVSFNEDSASDVSDYLKYVTRQDAAAFG